MFNWTSFRIVEKKPTQSDSWNIPTGSGCITSAKPNWNAGTVIQLKFMNLMLSERNTSTHQSLPPTRNALENWSSCRREWESPSARVGENQSKSVSLNSSRNLEHAKLSVSIKSIFYCFQFKFSFRIRTCALVLKPCNILCVALFAIRMQKVHPSKYKVKTNRY